MKSLNLQQLHDGSGPLWVLNNSAVLHPPGGDVYITVIGPDKRPIPIAIELTWLPKDLTTLVPRQSILESSYFYRAITEGIVLAITNEDAMAIMGKKGADREADRLKASAEAVKQATRAKGIAETVTICGGSETTQNQMIDMTDVSDHLDEGNISPNFKAWVKTLNGLDEDDAISRVKVRGSLSLEECYFLKNNIEHEKIAEVIGRKLKKL